jgi:hypothetical protein
VSEIKLLFMNIDIKFDQTGKIIPSFKGKEITMEDSPYMIYLATTGMCSAVYVRAFFNQRDMSLENVNLTQLIKYNQLSNMVDTMEVRVNLPEDFPGKYNKAIKAVVDQCPVKKHMVSPPAILVSTNKDSKVEV